MPVRCMPMRCAPMRCTPTRDAYPRAAAGGQKRRQKRRFLAALVPRCSIVLEKNKAAVTQKIVPTVNFAIEWLSSTFTSTRAAEMAGERHLLVPRRQTETVDTRGMTRDHLVPTPAKPNTWYATVA